MNGHEFTEEQSGTIDQVRMTLLHNSLLMFGIGLLLMFLRYNLPILPGWVTMSGATFFLVPGFLYFHPLVYFKRVTTNSADDINQMVAAMDNLQTTFAAGDYIVMIVTGLTLIEIFALLFN